MHVRGKQAGIVHYEACPQPRRAGTSHGPSVVVYVLSCCPGDHSAEDRTKVLHSGLRAWGCP
eukprot:3487509-Alexandrium_andersonii.AAC.1